MNKFNFEIQKCEIVPNIAEIYANIAKIAIKASKINLKGVRLLYSRISTQFLLEKKNISKFLSDSLS